MKLFRRMSLVTIIITLLICLFSQVVAFAEGDILIEDPAVYENLEDLPFHQKIHQWIAEIEKETLEQSFIGLQTTNDYFLNCVDDPNDLYFNFSGTVQSLEHYQIYQIFSNRRFLKVWQQLSDLRPEQRKQMITKFFIEFSTKHQELFSKEVDMLRDLVRKGHNVSTYTICTSKGSPASPTLTGTRYALMSTILLAKIYGVEDVLPELVMMGKNLESQYEQFKSQMIQEKLPYRALWYFAQVKNTPLLCDAVLNIGLSLESQQKVYTSTLLNEFEKNTLLQFETLRLSAWNARIGLFDQRHLQIGRLVDYSKGEFKTRYLMDIRPEDRMRLFEIAETYVKALFGENSSTK